MEKRVYISLICEPKSSKKNILTEPNNVANFFANYFYSLLIYFNNIFPLDIGYSIRHSTNDKRYNYIYIINMSAEDEHEKICINIFNFILQYTHFLIYRLKNDDKYEINFKYLIDEKLKLLNHNIEENLSEKNIYDIVNIFSKFAEKLRNIDSIDLSMTAICNGEIYNSEFVAEKEKLPKGSGNLSFYFDREEFSDIQPENSNPDASQPVGEAVADTQTMTTEGKPKENVGTDPKTEILDEKPDINSATCQNGEELNFTVKLKANNSRVVTPALLLNGKNICQNFERKAFFKFIDIINEILQGIEIPALADADSIKDNHYLIRDIFHPEKKD
jgi:hypothetical protein